jgi:hypothetical protein
VDSFALDAKSYKRVDQKPTGKIVGEKVIELDCTQQAED